MNGRHPTTRKPDDQCYSAQWSGVSYAKHDGKKCARCGTRTHAEGGSSYCPNCDDYVQTVKN